MKAEENWQTPAEFNSNQGRQWHTQMNGREPILSSCEERFNGISISSDGKRAIGIKNLATTKRGGPLNRVLVFKLCWRRFWTQPRWFFCILRWTEGSWSAVFSPSLPSRKSNQIKINQRLITKESKYCRLVWSYILVSVFQSLVILRNFYVHYIRPCNYARCYDSVLCSSQWAFGVTDKIWPRSDFKQLRRRDSYQI